MGRFKFLFFVVIAALLSCYKIPSKPPKWELTVRIPLGDSLVTAQDMINDTLNHRFTIERDPYYNDTLWTVFHYSDTATGFYYGSGQEIFKMTIKQKVSDNIDTTQSHYHSLARMLITKIYLKGKCDVDFYGVAVCSLTPPESLQHFTPFVDTFLMHIPQTNNLDTMMTFIIDSFPLGPYRNHITLYQDSGTIEVDSAMGYAKMPLDFLSRGDTLVTYMKGVKVDTSLHSNSSRHLVKKVVVHLVFKNRTPVGFTGNFRIGTKDSSVVYHTHPITVQGAPKNADGFTTGDSTVTVIEDTLTDDYVSMTDEDSLYWKASLEMPAFDKVFLRPEDWIRLYGYVSVTFWIDKDSL